MDETLRAPLPSPTPRATDSSWNSLTKGEEKISTIRTPRDTYGGLAEQTSLNHDVLIIRQFSQLNARNLFLMQAELVALENRLKLDEQEVIKEGQTKYLQNWQYLERSAHEGDTTALEYRRLVYEIRQRLKEYNEALQQQQFLSNLPTPSKYDLAYLRAWLDARTMGNMFLRGGDEAVYSNTALEHDLVSPRLSRDNDPFTKIVINNIILLWHTIIGRRIKQSSEGIYIYSEKWPLRMLRFLSTVVASMLPVAAVFALQGITPKPERYRLGAFAAFTFVFVVLMGLFTGAKRSEIFAAAAASVLILIVLPSKHRVRLGSSLILLSNTVLRGIKSISLQDLRLAQLSKLAQLIQVYIQGSLLTLPPAQIRRCSSRFHWYEQRQSSLKNSSRDSILAGDILVNAVARYQCGTANLRVPQGWPQEI